MKYNLLLAGLLAVGSGSAARTSHIEGEVVERLRSVPEGWTEVGAPHPDQKLRFRIAVRSVSNFLGPRYVYLTVAFTDYCRRIASCLTGRSWKFRPPAILAMDST